MNKLSLMLISILTIASVACGDDDDGGSGACKKAVEVLDDCDGVDVEIDPNASCTGQNAAFAQCIVDHPDAACGDQSQSDFSEYSKCVQDAIK